MKNTFENESMRVTVEHFVQNSKGEYQFLFTFVGGGFNSVFAFNKQAAIEKAKKEFSGLTVNESSFVKATEEMSREQDRMGVMMTC